MPQRPWPLTYRPSAWQDPLDPIMSALMPAYNAGVPRHDLGGVRRLLEGVAPARSPRRVVVVGTNGKSSTATYLARALTAAGVRTGLSTSPHLRSWTERVQIDVQPAGEDDVAAAMQRVHAVAGAMDERDGDLRFFDVLTIATEDLFGHAGVEVGVFEAGIGGRLDGTRVLDAELVLLTSIGQDHEAILGADPVQRLREKALAAGPGATLLAAPLSAGLEEELLTIASEVGFTAEVVRSSNEPPIARNADRLPAFQRANLALAAAGARYLLGDARLPAIATEIAGRFDQRTIDDVRVVTDVAHNPTAWRAFLAELPSESYIMLTAITEPRDAEELADAMAEARARVAEVIVTGTTVRPARDPAEVAATIRARGLDAVAVAEPEAAFTTALATARARGLPLAAFGSNYLVVDLLAWAATTR